MSPHFNLMDRWNELCGRKWRDDAQSYAIQSHFLPIAFGNRTASVGDSAGQKGYRSSIEFPFRQNSRNFRRGTLMLVTKRKKREKIVIADNIEITILGFDRKIVRFGIEAPKDIPVYTRLKGTTSEVNVKPSKSKDPCQS